MERRGEPADGCPERCDRPGDEALYFARGRYASFMAHDTDPIAAPPQTDCSPRPAAAPSTPRQVVVAITGATGAVYGVRLLHALRALPDVHTHLVVSPAGWMTIEQELGLKPRDVEPLADVVHGIREVGATIASGSFPTHAMVVAPCSMKTLAAVAHGLADDLVSRAADVTLKERRRLVLMVRETPFNLAHLRNMTAATEMGAIVFPPLPAFYHHPRTIDELVDHTVGRALELAGLPNALSPRWSGMRAHVPAVGGQPPTGARDASETFVPET